MIESILKNIKNWLEQQKKWHTLSYNGWKLKFDFNPRIGTCSVCGKRGSTNLHHTCYNFKRDEVRANPTLAWLFTYEACFSCHELSNSMRKLLVADPNMKLETGNKIVQLIYVKHLQLIQQREVFNEKRAVNIKKIWKLPQN